MPNPAEILDVLCEYLEHALHNGIINLVSTMIYLLGIGTISGLIATSIVMGFFGAWVLSRAAPQEQMVVGSRVGSAQQRRAAL